MNKYRFTTGVANTFIHIFLMLVAGICILPLLWMLGSSLKTQSTIFSDMSIVPSVMHWENFALAWTKGGFGGYFLNSLFYTVVVVLGIVIFSSWAAYAFSRMKFPGKNILFFMFLGALMIPLPGVFVALVVLVNNGRHALINFLDGVTPVLLKFLPQAFVAGFVNYIENDFYPRLAYILCMINVGLSLSIYMLKTFFDKMAPELEDAARIDGCSKIGMWWHVALPQAMPMLAVVVIFNALNVWNEYLLAMIIFDNQSLMPLQRALMMFRGEFMTNYPLLMAGLTITALPVIIVYLLMQKYVVKGVTAVVG